MTDFQKIDVRTLLSRVDCREIVKSDLGQPVEKSAKYCWWCCPFHAGDHTPSFAVSKDFYYCYSCAATGNAIDWKMKRHNLKFREACEAVDGGILPTVADFSKDLPAERPVAAKKPLPDQLQDAWREVIDVCQALLWSPAGQPGLDYLTQKRGLTEATLKSPFHKIGFSAGQKIADVWVDHGVVFPCFTVKPDLSIDYVNYVKIRRGQRWKFHPENDSKYRKLPGHDCDTSGLYNASQIKGADVVFVVEGEVDCLTLQQAAGDLVGCCTFGSASDQKLDWSRWGKYLSFARKIFVCLDADQAGQEAAKAWTTITGRATVVQTPGGFKDVNEAHVGGFDLRSWIFDLVKDSGIDDDWLKDGKL